MAFVRWRGNCAELLTTVYENGKSRQILLANLPQDYASDWVREQVAREHPDIRVDWLDVERALARGPKAKPTPEPPLTLLQAENLLRVIAQELRGDGLEPWQANRLNHAADILSSLHSDPRLAALCRDNPLNGEPPRNATLSSDDTTTSSDSPEPTQVSSDDNARPPPTRGGEPTATPNRSPKPQTSAFSPQPGALAGTPRRPPNPPHQQLPDLILPPRRGPFFFGLSGRTFPEWVAILIGIRT